jgi:hypothetical protein
MVGAGTIATGGMSAVKNAGDGAIETDRDLKPHNKKAVRDGLLLA